jgi:hypothetical protein
MRKYWCSFQKKKMYVNWKNNPLLTLLKILGYTNVKKALIRFDINFL